MNIKEIIELYHEIKENNKDLQSEELYNLLISKVSEEGKGDKGLELYKNFIEGDKNKISKDPIRDAKLIFTKNYRNNKEYEDFISQNVIKELTYQQIEALKPLDNNNHYFCELIESIGVENFLQFPIEKINAIKEGYYRLHSKEGQKSLPNASIGLWAWNRSLLKLGEELILFNAQQIQGLFQTTPGFINGKHILEADTIQNFGGKLLSKLSKEQLQALIFSYALTLKIKHSMRGNRFYQSSGFNEGLPNTLDEKIINLSPEQIIAYYYQYEKVYSFSVREKKIRDEKIEIDKLSAEAIKELGKME